MRLVLGELSITLLHAAGRFLHIDDSIREGFEGIDRKGEKKMERRGCFDEEDQGRLGRYEEVETRIR